MEKHFKPTKEFLIGFIHCFCFEQEQHNGTLRTSEWTIEEKDNSDFIKVVITTPDPYKDEEHYNSFTMSKKLEYTPKFLDENLQDLYDWALDVELNGYEDERDWDVYNKYETA